VRIAGIGERELPGVVVDLDGDVLGEADDAHVDGDDAFALRVLDPALLQPGVGIERERREPLRARDVEHRAAQPVPAHLRDRAVGVEDAHAAVRAGGLGRQQEEDTVAADAEASIAEDPRELGQDRVFTLRLHDDEVVPQPFVFCEGDAHRGS
jgi:hypothetical protein